MIGRHPHNYKKLNAITKKKYHCTNCNKQISTRAALYGQGRCNTCANKLSWQDKEYRDKTIKAMFKGMQLSPNNPEKCLIKLLNKLLPKAYTFVGNGKLIVNCFCPDFVNKDNNKIIEMFGDYWHNREDNKIRDKKRMKMYKKHGYKTLIIWQHELETLKLKRKILDFNKK